MEADPQLGEAFLLLIWGFNCGKCSLSLLA